MEDCKKPTLTPAPCPLQSVVLLKSKSDPTLLLKPLQAPCFTYSESQVLSTAHKALWALMLLSSLPSLPPPLSPQLSPLWPMVFLLVLDHSNFTSTPGPLHLLLVAPKAHCLQIPSWLLPHFIEAVVKSFQRGFHDHATESSIPVPPQPPYPAASFSMTLSTDILYVYFIISLPIRDNISNTDFLRAGIFACFLESPAPNSVPGLQWVLSTSWWSGGTSVGWPGLGSLAVEGCCQSSFRAFLPFSWELHFPGLLARGFWLRLDSEEGASLLSGPPASSAPGVSLWALLNPAPGMASYSL